MHRFHALFFAVLLLAAAGCGRSELGARCNTDDECAEGDFCVGGHCADEPDNNSAPCESDDDCPSGETCTDGTCSPTGTNNVSNNMACFENDQGVCVMEDCPGDNDCTPTPCDLGCGDGQVQDGCECVDVACETNDDCDGTAVCIDGICDQCKEDAHCPEGLVCSDGQCLEDTDCQEDTDCRPDERCAPDGVCRPRRSCVFDDDCPRDEICFNGRCAIAPECTEDADCPEGTECVGGNCFLTVCRGPDDCENGQICDAGECVDPPPVVMCQVATQDQLITDGQQIALEAFAFDDQGQAVAATFEWASSDPDVARIVPGPFALGGTSGGNAEITATIAGGDPIQCDGAAQLTNPGPVMTDTVRIVVTDAESGAGVAGATVRIGNATDTTNASGVANVSDPMTSSYDVDVFHDDFNWLTVQGVTSRDVKLPLLRQNGTGDVAGFTGEFDTSGLHSQGNITLGLAGASLAGGILELNLQRLLGDTFVTPLNIPGVADTDIPLPGGLVAYGGALGFNVDLKKTYYAQSAGGPRIAWGLAGLLPFSELLSFFQGGDFSGTDVLGQLLPLFNRFDHGAYPLVMQELPRITDTADFDRDGDTTEELPDYEAFPVVDLLPDVRQNLVTDVRISNFPTINGEQTTLGLLVGGVVLPSPGLVPTGISATTDEDGDGRPDTRRLSIAPAYGSLVGGRYSIVAITFGSGGGGGPVGPGGFALPGEFSVALWNGQSYPAALSLGTFPDSSTTSVSNGSRTVSVNASAGPMFRVRLQGEERSWDVWSLGPAGVQGQFSHDITIPAAPPMGGGLFQNGQIYVDAIQTNVNIDDLVGASGLGLTRAGLVTSAYNRTRAR